MPDPEFCKPRYTRLGARDSESEILPFLIAIVGAGDHGSQRRIAIASMFWEKCFVSNGSPIFYRLFRESKFSVAATYYSLWRIFGASAHNIASSYLKYDLLACNLLAIPFQGHIGRVRNAESPAENENSQGPVRMFERRKKPDCGEETGTSPKPEKCKSADERKQSDHNLISLWDERTDVGGGIVRLRNRREDEKGG